jgi:hypothetical protein
MAKKKELTVPAAEAEQIIDWCCDAWRRCQNEFTAASMWATWEQFSYNKLVSQDPDATADIVRGGEQGHPVADQALRKYISHMTSRDQHKDMLVGVRHYAEQCIRRAPVEYPTLGHSAVTFVKKRAWICLILELGSLQWGLRPTRNAATEAPSMAYYLALAFRRLINEGADQLKEGRINKIYFKRNALATILEASLAKKKAA